MSNQPGQIQRNALQGGNPNTGPHSPRQSTANVLPGVVHHASVLPPQSAYPYYTQNYYAGAPYMQQQPLPTAATHYQPQYPQAPSQPPPQQHQTSTHNPGDQQQAPHTMSPGQSRKRRASDKEEPILGISPYAAQHPSLMTPQGASQSSHMIAPPQSMKNDIPLTQGRETADATSAESPASANKKGRTNTPWTPQEEQRLKQMRDERHSWSKIAKTFPQRTEGSVKKHWYKDMHFFDFGAGGDDQSFTTALTQAIKEYENDKWKIISQKLGKPAKQCEQFAKEHDLVPNDSPED